MKPATGKWAGICLGICFGMATVTAAAAETTRYVVLVDGGKQAGRQVVTHGDDGVTEFEFEFVFKDNGRGPELKERFTLAADGTFQTYQVSGTSTFGALVEESFKRDGDRVQWKSKSDEGGKTVAGTALYVPLGGTPAGFSVAIGTLARRDDGKLPLIPGGTLSMRKVVEAQVDNGDATQTVQLVAMTGIGLTPTFAWATTGETPRLFAYIYPGFLQMVEQGWEVNADALEARQKQAEGEALVELQRRLAHPLAGSLLIRNARVFDSEHAALDAVSDVLVEGGRIVSIAATEDKPITANRTIDADGRVRRDPV